MNRFTILQRVKMMLSLKRNYSKFYERYENCKSDKEKRNALRSLIFSIIKGKCLFIEHFELIITTQCSLNCKGCSNMMPEYKSRKSAYFREKNAILRDIDAFTETVDEILNCRILGGEPLLHPDIAEILEYLLSKKNIGSIHIITNGTIIPKEKLIDVLKNHRVIVIFSDYGQNSRSLKGACNVLEQEKIRYQINQNLKWSDLGNMEIRQASREKLRKQRKACQFCCKTYLNGRLHLCPRSAFGTDLGYFDYDDEYIEMAELEISERRKRIAYLIYTKPYLKACAHCLAATSMEKRIDAGVQLPL